MTDATLTDAAAQTVLDVLGGTPCTECPKAIERHTHAERLDCAAKILRAPLIQQLFAASPTFARLMEGRRRGA